MQLSAAEMDAVTRRSLLLVSVAALMLSSCPGGPAAASPAAEEQSKALEEEDRPSCTSAVAVAEVARTAQLLCGAAPVEEALLSVRLQPGEATGAAGQLLEGLGLRTAVDLRLLGGGPEAQETMDALKTAGISIGDRSKIRMLVGDRAHLGRLFCGAAAQAGGQAAGGEASQPRRGLQTKAADSDTMSMDTVAIMLTVLVGAVGYAMQSYLAQRAEQNSAEKAQALHTSERQREREHGACVFPASSCISLADLASCICSISFISSSSLLVLLLGVVLLVLIILQLLPDPPPEFTYITSSSPSSSSSSSTSSTSSPDGSSSTSTCVFRS